MKRLLIILIILLPFSALSQDTTPTFGFKAGMNVSNQRWELNGAEWLKSEPVTGFQGSVFTAIPLGFGHISVQAGYVSKGSVMKLAYTDSSGIIREDRTKLIINYATADVLLEARIAIARAVFLLHAGPHIDIKAGVREISLDPSFSGNFRKTNLGLNLGIKYEFPPDRIKPFIELGHTPDLLNAYSKGNLKIRNRSFHLLCGLRF